MEKIDTTLRQQIEEILGSKEKWLEFVRLNTGSMEKVRDMDITYEVLVDSLLSLFEKEQKKRIGMLRQWLNEDRITDLKKMVTSEELEVWLIGGGE